MCFDLSDHKVAALAKIVHHKVQTPSVVSTYFFIQGTTASFWFSAYSHRFQILTLCVMDKFFNMIKITGTHFLLVLFFILPLQILSVSRRL